MSELKDGGVLELSATDLREVEAAVSRTAVHGVRYSEAAQQMVGW